MWKLKKSSATQQSIRGGRKEGPKKERRSATPKGQEMKKGEKNHTLETESLICQKLKWFLRKIGNDREKLMEWGVSSGEGGENK